MVFRFIFIVFVFSSGTASFAQTDDFSMPEATLACENSDFQACHTVAVTYLYGDHGITADYQKAHDFAVRACEEGVPKSCAVVGNLLIVEGTPVYDPPKAPAFLQMACENDVPTACSLLGEMYFKGVGLDKDLEQARDYYTKSCDGDFGKGCWQAAGMHENRDFGMFWFNKAYRLAKKSCELEFELGCEAFEQYDAIQKEFISTLTGECASGKATSCSELGNIHQWGTGVPKNSFRSREYYERGCDLGNGFGCWGAASLYLPESTSSPDLSKVYTFSERGCNLGSEDSCILNRQIEDERQAYVAEQNRRWEAENRRRDAVARGQNNGRGFQRPAETDDRWCGIIYQGGRMTQECMSREHYERYYE